jgi:YidC/Oxa1 family membrane protein insertase
MSALFHTYIFLPIYNLLVYLIGVVPAGDIGIAVILATVIVRLIIMPLTFAQLRSARVMKVLTPEMKAIQKKYKDNPEEKAKETFALYKRYKLNPFAGILVALIQLPILLGLYFVFKSHTLATIDASLLYSFIPVPGSISPLFLGLFTVAGSSVFFAALATALQALQIWYAVPVPAKSADNDAAEDFSRQMALQMRFVLPVFIGIAAFYTSNAIALYFITTALVSLVQEFFVRRAPLPTPHPVA